VAVKITAGHSGPLNARVAFTLNGVQRGDGSELIDLMRSDEPIDRQTREAIADALERREGVRLEFHRGNDAPAVEHWETELHYQDIADAVYALVSKPGGVEKNAKIDVAKQFGVSRRTVDTALRRRRHALYRISRG
jgi:hypothetical protein